MIKSLLLFIILLSPFFVYADTYTAISQNIYYVNGYQNVGSSDADAACAGYGGYLSLELYANNAATSCWGGSAGTGAYPDNQFANLIYGPVLSCPGGGTVSGTDCINAPSCISPQMRNATSGICEAPPVTCTAGQAKQLLVLRGTYPEPGGDAPTYKLTQDRTSVEPIPVTVAQGGCVYSLPLNPADQSDCHTSESGLLYCMVTATQTGTVLTGVETALDASTAPPGEPIGAASEGCYRTSDGEVCPIKPEKNCGSVNGVDVCYTDSGLTSGGYPAAMINGQVVAQSTNENDQITNCLEVNGKSLCVEPPTSSGCSGFITCLETEETPTQPSRVNPLSSHVKTLAKTATETAPDGTKTEVITTTTNVLNSTPAVTTNVYNSSGQKVSSETKGNASISTGGLASDSTAKGILDALNKSSGTTAKVAGTVGTAPADELAGEIEAKKSELFSLWQSTKADFIAITPILSGGGSYSCDAAVTTSFGASLDFCLGDHIQWLTVLGGALVMVATIAGVLMILG